MVAHVIIVVVVVRWAWPRLNYSV